MNKQQLILEFFTQDQTLIPEHTHYQKSTCNYVLESG